MNETLSVSNPENQPLYWSNELSSRFFIIASLLYLGALSAHLIYVWQNDCGFAFITQGPEVYTALLLGMIAFEYWAHRRYGKAMTRETGIWLIAARVVMYETAASMDCTSFAIVLYLLLPFLAYIFINKWGAIALMAAFLSWTTYKVGVFRCPDCPLDERVTPVILLGFGMLWSTAMGGIIQLVESNRTRAKKLLSDLELSYQALQNYAGRIEELTVIEERNRLARDIHDSVGHSLAVVNVQLENALLFQDHDAAVTRKSIRNAQQAAREALGDVRKSVRTLRETEDFFSLTTALERLAKRLSSERLNVLLDIQGDEGMYPQPSLLVLYRIAQEGLTNVFKHAEASEVSVHLVLGSSTALLEITDNGRGFDVTEVENALDHHEGHYGLRGIRERLELVGGTIDLKSSSSSGTALSIRLPRNGLNALQAEGTEGER